MDEPGHRVPADRRCARFLRRADEVGAIGDDFREGKITLPIILAFRRGDDEERVLAPHPGDLKTEDDWPRALELMTRHDALIDVARAQHYGAIARDSLRFGMRRKRLDELIDFCIHRAY